MIITHNQANNIKHYLDMLTNKDIRNEILIREALYTAEKTGLLEDGVSVADAITIWRIVTAFGNIEAGSETDQMIQENIRM